MSERWEELEIEVEYLRPEVERLTADLARVRAALRHEVNRNHEHTEACSACQESDAALEGR